MNDWLNAAKKAADPRLNFYDDDGNPNYDGT